MEREEGTTVAGDSQPTGGSAHSENSVTTSGPASDLTAPAELWRDYLSSWIGGSGGQLFGSSLRGEAAPGPSGT